MCLDDDYDDAPVVQQIHNSACTTETKLKQNWNKTLFDFINKTEFYFSRRSISNKTVKQNGKAAVKRFSCLVAIFSRLFQLCRHYETADRRSCMWLRRRLGRKPAERGWQC